MNTITLLDGTILNCYPKEEKPEVILEDVFALDKTGEYLLKEGDSHKVVHEAAHTLWEDLFFKEAFFLYEHRKEILSDSRMFLTPLPFRSGLAYTGTSGFQNATLGVYLEWWGQCASALIMENGEIAALTYFIAGSPLSGSNRCSAVRRDGKTMNIIFNSFLEIWSSFLKINGLYTEAKQLYQAFSLEETVAKLRSR